MENLPSVAEMMDALSSPVIPMNSVREEERSEDMKSHTDILLDLVKAVHRVEMKLNSGGGLAKVQPDPNLFGVTSNQLEM